MVAFPSKANTLVRLKAAGLEIGTVIDVGAHEQTLELREAFPDIRHILFEPAEEFHDKIATHYAGMDYVLAPLAVSDVDGSGNLKKFDIDGGGVSHSTLVNPETTAGSSSIATVRLDTFLKDRDDKKPYLLKIDVDGYEVPIMRGLGESAADIACMIVEATRDTFIERLNVAASLGFQLIDIIDPCYYYGVFSQADLVFISPAVGALPDMRPWETKEFGWDKWIPVASFENYVQSVSAANEEAAAAAAET